MKTTEFVLAGDVIKSRRKFDTKNWDLFHNSIDQLNAKFSDALKIPFAVYSGDSFGGICKDFNSSVLIILKIQEYLRNFKSRIVLIEDEVSYGLENQKFQFLEGPALWKIPSQLERVKRNDTFFLADLQNEKSTIKLNTIVNLLLIIKDDWNEIEWQLYQEYEHRLNQKELARKLNVSQQYISKIYKSSKVRFVKEAESNLNLMLNDRNKYPSC